MSDPLVETWLIHDRINRYLLAATAEEAMPKALAAKHRTVFGLFAHIHNVRLMWLKSAAPALLAKVSKIEGTAGSKAELDAALQASGAAIAEMLEGCGGKVKGFKPHATAFVGYLLSHESHHRAQVVWTLKNTGHPIDQKTSYGLWEWGVR